MLETERDSQAFDAILKAKLSRAILEATMKCPELSTLAAFYDRAIGGHERDQLEDHIADCARCQSMLAAMARADDDILAQPHVERGFDWDRMLRFAVPAFAAIAAVVVVLKLRNPFTSEQTPTEIAMNSPIPAPPAEVAGGLANQAVPQVAAPAQAPPSAPNQPTAPAAPPPGNIGNFSSTRRLHAMASSMALMKRESASAATSAPRVENLSANRLPPAISPGAKSAAAVSAPEMLAQSDTSASPSAMGASAGAIGAAAPQAHGTFTIESPDQNAIWIVGPHGSIVKHTASGKVKQQQSGVTVDLTQGAAISARECWIVGQHGTILRTRDGGGYWESITSPTTEDLAHVRAADSQDAVIRTVSGKSYATTDGGLSWQHQ